MDLQPSLTLQMPLRRMRPLAPPPMDPQCPPMHCRRQQAWAHPLPPRTGPQGEEAAAEEEEQEEEAGRMAGLLQKGA